MKRYDKNYKALLAESFPVPQLLFERHRQIKLLWERTRGLTTPIAQFNLMELHVDCRIQEGILSNFVDYTKRLAKELTAAYYMSYSYEIGYLLIGGVSMQYKTVLNLSYGKRDRYYSALYQIQNLVDENGMFSVFVNNNIYSLEFKVCIHAPSNAEAIKKIIADYALESTSEQDADTMLLDMGKSRRYDMLTFPANMPYDQFVTCIASRFHFKTEEEAAASGYGAQKTVQPKLFISYSHKDNHIVKPLTDALQDAGLDIWIDIRDIEVGDNILRDMSYGLQKSDLGVLFLSQHYNRSDYAQFELEQLMNNMLARQNALFPVKVDTIDPNVIFYGLKNFKYYDLQTDSNQNHFVAAIEKKVKALRASGSIARSQ